MHARASRIRLPRAQRAPPLINGAISDSLYPANNPKDERDENNGSEEAADIHRNLLAVTFDVIRAWPSSAVGAPAHTAPSRGTPAMSP
jgi:hypothetical protein